MNGIRLEHDWFPEPIPANVTLGERSWLYSSYAFRHYRSRRPAGVRVGRDTGIYHGTFFDLGPEGEVSIGDFCTLVGATLCTNGRIEIADYVFIAHEVVLADSPVAVPFRTEEVRSSVRRPNPRSRMPEIRIGENAWIGARAIVLAGAEVGPGAVIGAGAVIDSKIPPFVVAAGNPARIVRHLRS